MTSQPDDDDDEKIWQQFGALSRGFTWHTGGLEFNNHLTNSRYLWKSSVASGRKYKFSSRTQL